MLKYSLEFVLHSYNSTEQSVKSHLSEFGTEIAICESSVTPGAKGKDFKVNITTEDPTVIFDLCSQMGRIKAVKIDELK